MKHFIVHPDVLAELNVALADENLSFFELTAKYGTAAVHQALKTTCLAYQHDWNANPDVPQKEDLEAFLQRIPFLSFTPDMVFDGSGDAVMEAFTIEEKLVVEATVIAAELIGDPHRMLFNVITPEEQDFVPVEELPSSVAEEAEPAEPVEEAEPAEEAEKTETQPQSVETPVVTEEAEEPVEEAEPTEEAEELTEVEIGERLIEEAERLMSQTVEMPKGNRPLEAAERAVADEYTTVLEQSLVQHEGQTAVALRQEQIKITAAKVLESTANALKATADSLEALSNMINQL